MKLEVPKQTANTLRSSVQIRWVQMRIQGQIQHRELPITEDHNDDNSKELNRSTNQTTNCPGNLKTDELE